MEAVIGHSIAWLTFAIVAENFTSAIGTVIFVAYLSALCRNPLHTATQYALLTALAAVRPDLYVVGSGLYRGRGRLGVVLRHLCGCAGLPALVLLAWLYRRGHFDGLMPHRNEPRGTADYFPGYGFGQTRGGAGPSGPGAGTGAQGGTKRTGPAQKTRKKVFL